MSRSKTIVTDEEESSATDFVSRWSRLKHEAKENAVPADAVADVSELAEKLEVPVSDVPVKVLTDADMPDIKLMTDDSDYTDFLSPGVSEALRKLALRKLFHSEVFNICDGLDDYDEDFTQFKLLGDTVTSDMRHQVELKAQRMAEELLQEKEQSLGDDGIDDGINEIDADNISSDSSGENKLAATITTDITTETDVQTLTSDDLQLVDADSKEST